MNAKDDDGAENAAGDGPEGGTADEQELTFEQAMEKLEAIVDRLESGELGLEEAMEAFEEGNRLAGVCRDRLEEAEGKLEELLDDGGTAAFEVEAEEDDGDGGENREETD